MNVADGSVRSPAVEAARAGDLIGIQWLLDLESLPSADLTETALGHFLVVRDEIGVIGVVGLEVYGQLALLRSLVVAKSHSGRRIERHAAPPEIQRSAEFSSLCPSSATVMAKP
jgi:amino-acid N-acetyltransferase